MSSPWTGKHGPLFIAEIGGNHEGDFAYACRLTELAIGADVDYVKFQLYTGDGLVSYVENPDRNKHFKKFQLTREQHRHLAETCTSAGIGYMASVWELRLLEWVDEYMAIYKIGSGDMTAFPILRAFAERRKPIILSTGMATLEEVMEAVTFLRTVDTCYNEPDWLSLLQCTSSYPNDESDANLAVMDTLRDATGLPVGYSDHTRGIRALATAKAMGASILEFHFTDTREGKTFRDHLISLTQEEVIELQTRSEDFEELHGQSEKRPTATELETMDLFRRAVYLTRDIPRGHVVVPEDLVCLRPNHGIDARDFDKLPGKTAARDLRALTAMDWTDFNT